MHHHCPLSQLPVRPILSPDPEPGGRPPVGHLDVPFEGSWHLFLKGAGSSDRLCPGCQEKKGHQEATWLQRVGWNNADKGPALVLEYSVFFRIQISKTQAFQLFLLNLMDLRNRTFLMMLLFDFLEIFNKIFSQMQAILSPPDEGENLRVTLE